MKYLHASWQAFIALQLRHWKRGHAFHFNRVNEIWGDRAVAFFWD